MTVIAARKYHDKIVMAADSFIGNDEVNYNHQCSTPKMFDTGECVIGLTGSADDASLLRIFSKTHKLGDRVDQSRVMDWLMEYAEWKKSKVGEWGFKSWILLAHKSGLYVCYGISCHEVDEFASIGAGQDFANTALYLGKSPSEAAKIACRISNKCAEPVTEMEVCL
jgi:ATP-dependent protease HslVU (ClpYQ) peptidase subunit